MKSLLLASALFVTLSCGAQEYMPFPRANVKPEQWQSYLEEVQRHFRESERVYDAHKLVIYRDEKTLTSWTFTMEGNPAHPAWITRKATTRDGAIYMEQIGYFAGNEEAFAKLFQAYRTGIDLTREYFRSRGQ